jgi:hypothetical protein
MGYMGFGMQSWVYKQKPKGGFTRIKALYEREGAGYIKRTNTQEWVPAALGEAERLRIRQAVKKQYRREIRQKTLILLFCIGLFAGILWLIGQRVNIW